MRGYDTLFVQRVKAAASNHEVAAVRNLLRTCLSTQAPVAEVAELFGVSRGTVYNWMTGQTTPHPLHIRNIPGVIAALKRK